MITLGRVVATRRSSRDDIPVARRSKPAPRQRSRGFGVFLACLLVGGGSLAAVWLGPGLLARRPSTVNATIRGFVTFCNSL